MSSEIVESQTEDYKVEEPSGFPDKTCQTFPGMDVTPMPETSRNEFSLMPVQSHHLGPMPMASKMEGIQKEVKDVKSSESEFPLNVAVVVNQTNGNSAQLLELPEIIQLPVCDDAALNEVDKKLKEDKNLQSVLLPGDECNEKNNVPLSCEIDLESSAVSQTSLANTAGMILEPREILCQTIHFEPEDVANSGPAGQLEDGSAAFIYAAPKGSDNEPECQIVFDSHSFVDEGMKNIEVIDLEEEADKSTPPAKKIQTSPSSSTKNKKSDNHTSVEERNNLFDNEPPQHLLARIPPWCWNRMESAPNWKKKD